MDEMKKEANEIEETPAWKRKAAWGLVVLLGISIVLWLVSIAMPDWVNSVRSWF